MEFRDALKLFRSQVGLAQADVAAALHINISTVARWEQGKTVPNRSIALLLLDYAKQKNASELCVTNLEKALNSDTKHKLFNGRNSLFSVEHATISQLIEEASFPVYVCDLETDEVLYANHATEQQLGKHPDELVGCKCYESIMHREKPCDFCHKSQLTDSFCGYEAFRHSNGRHYRVFGKLVQWNGRPAQVRYALELGGSVQIASDNERRLNYEKSIALRRQYAGDALATACYNLTRGTVSQVEFRSEEIARLSAERSYEEVVRVLKTNLYSSEEREKLDSVRSCDSLIKLYYQGKTHISIKHRIRGIPGYFEDSFDLFQNPSSYDIEAFSTLRDITDEAVSDAIVGMISRGSFESILTIDAATGKAHPYRGSYIGEIVKEQERLQNNVAAVEDFLRRHCAAEDAERVTRQTALAHVKESLKTTPVFTVAFSFYKGELLTYMQAQYSYLDEEQTTLLCVTQDISEAYKQLHS